MCMHTLMSWSERVNGGAATNVQTGVIAERVSLTIVQITAVRLCRSYSCVTV